MREIKKDTRAYDRMCELKIGYAQLSDRLKVYGLDISAKTLFKYIAHRESPNKSVKRAIAKALNCLVSDIF